ncbi:MAG: 2OG-Fe(II) oxygenase [Ilumatobacteraceae bacterium]|nr:2OG-Fe(II) oxygenase [Ilumatobacteraceae bacterium]
MVDFKRLDRILAGAHDRYASAEPFPHIVIDDFLADDVFRAAVAEFPPIDRREWTSYVHLNERKYGNPHPDSWEPPLQQIARDLTSKQMVTWLQALTGFPELLADWSMDGGGLHQTFRGGHLNLHADFTAHHTQRNWRRRVNLLLYLNPEWDDAWGGHLELWDADRSRCVEKVAPTGNRAVIFTTDADSYHGHPDPLQCPEGEARRSLALYYFEEQANPLARSTDYRARPTDRLRRVAIYVDKQALRGYDMIKRRFRLPDDIADRTLRILDRRNRTPR